MLLGEGEGVVTLETGLTAGRHGLSDKFYYKGINTFVGLKVIICLEVISYTLELAGSLMFYCEI
jgi:hypothetical protein